MSQSEKKKERSRGAVAGRSVGMHENRNCTYANDFFLKQKVGCVRILIAHVGTVERLPNSVAALHPTKLKV